MEYRFPFGEVVRPLVQEDQSPKEAFVLGVYASAVHARWKRDGKIVCQALAVASEPRIFWDGNPPEAQSIIGGISIPSALGTLEPAGKNLNGPSAKVLDEHILKPLGLTRSDAWLCDCLPETRLNPSQLKVIRERYDPLIEQFGLNEVTIPKRPNTFCNDARAAEITRVKTPEHDAREARGKRKRPTTPLLGRWAGSKPSALVPLGHVRSQECGVWGFSIGA